MVVDYIPVVTGIDPHKYTNEFRRTYPSLPKKSATLIQFLLENKKALYEGINKRVETREVTTRLAEKVKNKDTLQALLLFTFAHYQYGEEERILKEERENILNLYENTMMYFDSKEGKKIELYNPMYLDDDSLELMKYIPRHFLYSPYRNQLNTHLSHLKSVQEKRSVEFESYDMSEIEHAGQIGIYTEDFPGLWWRIAGVCYQKNINIVKANMYSLKNNPSLAMDFLHLRLPDRPLKELIPELKEELTRVITGKEDIAVDPSEILKKCRLSYQLEAEQKGFRLGITIDHDEKGLSYAVTKPLSPFADIQGVSNHKHRKGSFTDYYFLETALKEEEFKDRIDSIFRPYVSS